MIFIIALYLLIGFGVTLFAARINRKAFCEYDGSSKLDPFPVAMSIVFWPFSILFFGASWLLTKSMAKIDRVSKP
jgi:hypothetical protein